MSNNQSYSPIPFTHGEARRWARRLRKLGFSPVTMHHTDWDDFGRPADGFQLRCSWPYDGNNLPEDLYQQLADYDGLFAQKLTVANRFDAVRVQAQYREVRLGMGSRPIPQREFRDFVPPLVPRSGVVFDYADWPFQTERDLAWEELMRALSEAE